MTALPFSKMSGAGNDFVLIDNRNGRIRGDLRPDRLREADFADLGKIVWMMEQAARKDDLLRVVAADVAFHEAVIARSGQPPR